MQMKMGDGMGPNERGGLRDLAGGRPLVLAHRGWSAAYPENTLSAFREALNAGADGLEFDVQLTADGEIVVIHDADVSRVAGGSSVIRETDFEAVAAFNVAANWPSHPVESIPSLGAVLDLAYELNPGGVYNIEIKTYSEDWGRLVDAVIDLTATHPLRQRLLFSSFTHAAVAYLKKKSPDAEIGLLFEDNDNTAWQKAVALQAYSVNMNFRTVTADFVAACHEHGVQVAVWTVDQPDDLERMDRAGVDLLITNRVDNGLAVLRG